MDYQSKSKDELIKELLELQQKQKSTLKSLEDEIAEHKQFAKDLEKENALMQAVINQTTDAIYVKDIDGKYLLFNHAAETFTGKKSNDVLCKDDSYLFPADEAKIIMDTDQKVLEEGSIKTYEEFATSAQGLKLTFLSTKGPILNKNGKPFGLFGITRNITERKLAEEQLIENENKFRKIYEEGPFGMALANKEFKFLLANNMFCQIVGYSEKELQHLTFTQITHVDDIHSDFINVNKLIAGEIPIYKTEKRYVKKDGQIIWASVTVAPNFKNDGTFLYNIAIITDITEHKKAANALRISEDKFRKAFFTNPDAITITRLKDGMYISANYGFTQIFEYTEDEILEKTTQDINIWHNYEDRNNFIQCLQTKGVIENFETQFNTKSGKIIDALVFSTFIELEGIPHTLTITRDITGQKKAEQDLKQSRDLLLNLAQLVPGVIYQFRLYPDGRSAFPYSSPGMFTIYEFTPEEVQFDATPVYSRLHPDDYDNVVKLITESANNLNTFYCEFRVNLPEQGLRWRWSQAHPIRMDDGSILWHGIISDITERKKAEIELKEKSDEIETQNEEYQQLNKELIHTNEELKKAKEHAEQSDHLKTAFLQNMSHEIRTPMNAIMGFSELLVRQYNNKAKLEQYSQIITQRCADLLDIINEILDVAKIETGQLPVKIEECNLNSLFSEISAFFKGYLKRPEKQHLNFEVKINCGTHSTIIRADKVKVKQIFINLIDNAFKFTDHGEIQAGCLLDNNQQLLFYVSDSGVGIPPDKQDFIFERFAQLEPTPGRIYGGTGLGLSIVKGLSDLLGGKIWLESVPEKGTTFYFNFPYEIVDCLPNERIENVAQAKFNFSGKTILIVEDDQYNADYLKEVLDETGIKIIHTFYGNEAIQISKSQKLDLVLMDIRLPDLDGYTATQSIRKSKPDLKIIIQTAYAANEDKEMAIDAGCNDYISKPVKSDILLSVIDKHLSK
jgi:PAS domain S-box-containing protein